MNQQLPPIQATAVRYRILAWLCSLSMITYIDRVCIMQVREDIELDLGIEPWQFSFAFSAFALAYAAFEVPGGWLGDRYGARRVLTKIVLCWLTLTALTGAVWNWASLVVIRTLFGAGEAGAYPNMARATRNWFPYRERGQAQGLIWTFGRFGGALSPVLITFLATPFGWRGAFVMLGMLGVVWLLGFTRWFRDRPEEHPRVNEAELAMLTDGVAKGAAPAPLSWSSVLSSPTLWFLSIMYFCSNSGWSFFITWVPAYMKNELKLSGTMLDLASGAPLFFGAIGCFLGGLLTDRQVRVWGRRWGRTMQGFIAYLLGGTFFLASKLFTDDSPGLALVALCAASFVKDFGMAASWSTTIDIGHRYSGSVAGVMNTIGNLGTVVSPPIVALIARLAKTDAGDNWSLPLFYYAGMFYIAALCWLFVNPTRVIVYAPEDHERLRAEGVLS